MPAINSVQSNTATSGATGVKSTAQSNGDTGFLAALDQILQAANVAGAAGKAAAPATPAVSTAGQANEDADTAADVGRDAELDGATQAVDLPKASDAPAEPASAVKIAAPATAAPIAMAPVKMASVQMPAADGNDVAEQADEAEAFDGRADASAVAGDTSAQPVAPNPQQAAKTPAVPMAQAASAATNAEDELSSAVDDRQASPGQPDASAAAGASPATAFPVKAKAGAKQGDDGDTIASAPAQPADTASAMILAAAATQSQATAPQPQVDPRRVAEPTDSIAAAGRGGRSSASPGVTILTQDKADLDVEVSGEVASDGRSSGHASMQTGALQAGTSSTSAAPQQARPSASGQTASANTTFDADAQTNAVAPAGQPIQPDIDGAVRAKAAETTVAATDIKPPTSQDGTLSLTVQPQATATADAKADTATTPVTPAEQVSLVVQKGLAEGKTSMTIALNPDNLGKVEVKLDIAKDGSVQASVIAENADTLTMLKNDNAGLHQALHNAGLSTDSSSLNFSLRSDNHGQSQGQGFAEAQQQQQSARNSALYRIQASVAGENSAAAPVTGTQYASSSGNSRVDLFV